jgi:hypothetical protein
VSIAWKCALDAYDPTALVSDHDCQHYKFKRDHVVVPSISGTVKAMTTTIVVPRDDSELDNEFLPLMVVAVRGSASQVDHMVNANAKPKSVSPFVVGGFFCSFMTQYIPATEYRVFAHVLNSWQQGYPALYF